MRLDTFSEKKCIFCSKAFTQKKPAVSPDVLKLDSVFNACTQRQDEIGGILLENKSKILNKEQLIYYHRDCRSTYCSSHHIARAVEKHENDNSNQSVFDSNHGDGTNTDSASFIASSRVFTRGQSSNASFDWKTYRFICGEVCHTAHRYSSGNRNWSMVETVIDGTTESIYCKILDAAKRVNDDVMITRLEGVGPDLVAKDARYHRKRNCLSKYLNQKEEESSKSHVSELHSALSKLTEEYHDSIVQDRQVHMLSTLTNRFNELLERQGCSSLYTSQHLKQRLQKKWPTVLFLQQHGRSDFVCSQNITVVDALQKVTVLLATDEIENQEELSDDMDEENVVHTAVGILRKRMKNTDNLKDEYFSAEEITKDSLMNYVDPLLYKTVGWLTDEQLFETAGEITTKDDTKCLNIACDITSLATSTISPKHLGMSVHFHHEFGSRKLIDDLYHLGYGISYTETRRFSSKTGTSFRPERYKN